MRWPVSWRNRLWKCLRRTENYRIISTANTSHLWGKFPRDEAITNEIVLAIDTSCQGDVRRQNPSEMIRIESTEAVYRFLIRGNYESFPELKTHSCRRNGDLDWVVPSPKKFQVTHWNCNVISPHFVFIIFLLGLKSRSDLHDSINSSICHPVTPCWLKYEYVIFLKADDHVYEHSGTIQRTWSHQTFETILTFPRLAVVDNCILVWMKTSTKPNTVNNKTKISNESKRDKFDGRVRGEKWIYIPEIGTVFVVRRIIAAPDFAQQTRFCVLLATRFTHGGRSPSEDSAIHIEEAEILFGEICVRIRWSEVRKPRTRWKEHPQSVSV